MHTHTHPENQQRQHHHHLHHHHHHHHRSRLDELEKRTSSSSSSSMIFRIEQLLPSTSNTSSSITQAPAAAAGGVGTGTGTGTGATAPASTASTNSTTMLTKRGRRDALRPGVYTLQYTTKDTFSNTVATSDLINSSAMPTDITRSHCQISASNGELIMSASLLRQIKLSEDIYSFNAIFELSGGQVRIRLVRDVARDDEIVAWFGEELVLLMGIPFLTPLNIQGNNRYTCHLCHLTFETPHPLKIHLALGCGRNAMDILWMRLHYALKAAAAQTTTQSVRGQLSPKPTASSASSSASPTHSPTPPQMPIQRFSAFRPISGLQTLTPPPPPAATAATLSYLPSISMAATSGAHHSHLNAAAQIEAIVSNMGASKQGHLCIYCGKVYSRKYGLKIHIRTHTGFKPLKCKFCLRPFGDPSNLNKHVRLHLQTQPNSTTSGHSSDVDIEGETDADRSGHQCRLCQKGFARRRDLQRHMETRHGGGGGSSSMQSPTTTSTITGSTSTLSKTS
ncbi:sal-like protein 4 [Drosophila willistoni]|uniref:sal-like protein 4 n=1 Tax=Drosophila willistoni TaxID=7260 RepID=UPI001F07FA01|nr:sal-like protein 4 [Drosophila willistoni]